jgi:hypothetical protein
VWFRRGADDVVGLPSWNRDVHVGPAIQEAVAGLGYVGAPDGVGPSAIVIVAALPPGSLPTSCWADLSGWIADGHRVATFMDTMDRVAARLAWESGVRIVLEGPISGGVVAAAVEWCRSGRSVSPGWMGDGGLLVGPFRELVGGLGLERAEAAVKAFALLGEGLHMADVADRVVRDPRQLRRLLADARRAVGVHDNAAAYRMMWGELAPNVRL